MKYAVYICLIVLLLMAPGSVFSFKIDGEMETYSGAIFDSSEWIRNSANLRVKSKNSIGPGSLSVECDIAYDSVNGDSPAFIMRQLEYSHSIFLTGKISELRFGGGLMQFSWGKSDELRIVDILNPQNYNFSLFQEISDRQLGRLALSASITFGMYTTLQVVVLPMERFSMLDNRQLLPSSMAEVQSMSDNGYISSSIQQASKKIKDTGVAARLTGTLTGPGLDYGFYFYHGNSLLPSFSWSPVTVSSNNTMGLHVERQFPTLDMVGFAFEKALSGFVFQGEIAWFFHGKQHQMTRTAMTNSVASGGNGLLERDLIQYVVGFDHQNFIIKKLYFNLQFSQNYILDHTSILQQDAREDIVTVQFKYDWLQKTVQFETTAIWYMRRGWMINPELSIKLATGAYLHLGAYLIGSDEDDYLLANYNKMDFGYLKFRIQF